VTSASLLDVSPPALGLVFTFLVFALGAAIGSFLNVVIHRVPRGESIVHPGSHCPGCQAPIPAWANVPIVAWFALRGRCRSCREPISPRYVLVEALTGAVFVALYLHEGLVPRLLADWALASALIAITFIDLDWQIVPNVITYPGIVLAFLAAFFLPPPWWGSSLPFIASAALGALVGGGMMLAVSLYYEWRSGRIGLGLGDVKLITMLGAFLGLEPVLSILVMGSLLGILHWSVLMIAGRAGRLTRIAFAPSLAAAGLLHLFYPVLLPTLLPR
jgi:leader peptidase (prepilin peptidase) / N-methyltransferase